MNYRLLIEHSFAWLHSLRARMTRLQLALVYVVLVFALLAVAPFSIASAAERCASLSGTDRGACMADPDAWFSEDNDVLNIIPLAINIFSIIVGVVSVIMIIVGGLKYITSSGDSGNVTSAKNTILYAVIGLVVVALAQVIVRFVLSEVG